MTLSTVWLAATCGLNTFLETSDAEVIPPSFKTPQRSECGEKDVAGVRDRFAASLSGLALGLPN